MLYVFFRTIMKLRQTAALLWLSILSLPAFAIDFGRIPQDEISVYVQELDSGNVLVDHRSNVPVNPASTMKLVTAFAAFKALGGDYRWPTQFKSDGTIQGDTLQGDIYWVGSGDPVFDQEGLVGMQQQLRDKGIRKITGGLVLDRHLWGDIQNPSDFESDVGSLFMTPPDPHMLAYKVVSVKPERNDMGGVDLVTNPPLPDIKIDNKINVTPSNASCKALQNHMRANYKGGVLHVSGKVPESCLGNEMYVNMLNMREFVQKSFINQWRYSGGEITDGIKVASVPPHAKTLAVHQSKPMSAILTDMNKYSNNLIARSVFLKLGGEHSGNSALQQASSAVKRELATAGVDTENLVLENGSGLSRRERVSANMLAQMLEKAYFSPFKQDFIDTLPIAGKDGTLKYRLKQVGPALRLKTGTLKDVRALAGYWLGDKPMIVVVVINSPNATNYLNDLDKLVSKIVQPGGDAWIDAKMKCAERMEA